MGSSLATSSLFKDKRIYTSQRPFGEAHLLSPLPSSPLPCHNILSSSALILLFPVSLNSLLPPPPKLCLPLLVAPSTSPPPVCTTCTYVIIVFIPRRLPRPASSSSHLQTLPSSPLPQTKRLYAVRMARKQADEDVVTMQNRIKRLQLEEDRARKNIDETRRRADGIVRMKAQNELRARQREKERMEKEYQSKMDAHHKSLERAQREANIKANKQAQIRARQQMVKDLRYESMENARATLEHQRRDTERAARLKQEIYMRCDDPSHTPALFSLLLFPWLSPSFQTPTVHATPRRVLCVPTRPPPSHAHSLDESGEFPSCLHPAPPLEPLSASLPPAASARLCTRSICNGTCSRFE